MNRLLSRLKLWQKIVVIICTFTLPLGILGVFVFQGYHKDMQFAQMEKYGNEYQRPLEDLLASIAQHQSLCSEFLAGDKQVNSDISSKAAQIDKDFEALESVDAKLGTILQFTEEGLAKRKREHVRVRNVKGEWLALKAQAEKLSAEACQEQHAHLVGDIRTMITHAGDMSNLILDPDLDSYYLMDVTLGALPQTQDRLAVITSYGQELLKKKTGAKSEVTQLAVHGALLKEADLERVQGNTQTALNEDENFYGKSESLQRNIPPALNEYAAATKAFLALIDKIVSADKLEVEANEFRAAGNRAREASFKFWQVADTELDLLLQKRIDYFKHLWKRVLSLTLSALSASAVLTFFIVRCVTKPIAKLTLVTSAAAQAGDLTQKVEVKARDEVGALGGAFNKMIEGLHGMVLQVQQSGIQVNTAATEIAATSKEQQATASEIAATTVEIGATSKQISATASELVQTISEVTHVAEQTAQVAGRGQDGIGRMEETMRQITGASSTIASKLAVLNEKAGNINTVVTTINKVADQTNLLSLNAAIEAEKAGEYGLGFAVVATEIRRLADQTAVATYDIEQMVKEMQSAVSAGVMGMDRFSEEVRKGVNDVRQVGGQLGEIIQQVQALTPRFESVSDGMKSQASGAQQISEALEQLSESAQQTAESLQQSYQVIERLNDAARGLQSGVSRFKLAA